jgi:hypothetical protein
MERGMRIMSWVRVFCAQEHHAPTEDKIDDVKDSFYKELECDFDKFLKYHESSVRRFQCRSRQLIHFLN